MKRKKGYSTANFVDTSQRPVTEYPQMRVTRLSCRLLAVATDKVPASPKQVEIVNKFSRSSNVIRQRRDLRTRAWSYAPNSSPRPYYRGHDQGKSEVRCSVVSAIRPSGHPSRRKHLRVEQDRNALEPTGGGPFGIMNRVS